ncbi:MAG: c-di-GMP-binding flagellar brake protein YcgR [Pseudohongiellaceae bacterium]
MVENSSVSEHVEITESFSDLSLTIGASLTVETISPVRKYSVHLLGYAENRSLFISTPLRDGKEVLLDKGCVVAVRLLVGKNVCAFESKVLYRSLQPYTYYHLAYPQEITVLQVRNSERVAILIETDVDSDFDIVGDWPRTATINNLSKTGARLISATLLGEKGQEILLQFGVIVSGINKRVCLPSIIRNVENNESGEGQTYAVGVQFLELTDEEMLTLSTYIYENEH